METQDGTTTARSWDDLTPDEQEAQRDLGRALAQLPYSAHAFNYLPTRSPSGLGGPVVIEPQHVTRYLQSLTETLVGVAARAEEHEAELAKYRQAARGLQFLLGAETFTLADASSVVEATADGQPVDRVHRAGCDRDHGAFAACNTNARPLLRHENCEQRWDKDGASHTHQCGGHGVHTSHRCACGDRITTAGS